MKQFSFKSIYSRLTYWFLFLTLIPLLFSLSIVYLQSVQIIENRTINKLIAIRDLKVNRLTDWITEREGDMNMLQTEIELTNLETLINKSSYNKNDNITLNTGRNHLNYFINSYSSYAELYIINPINGKILISTNTLMEGKNHLLDNCYTKTLMSRKLVTKDIYYSQRMSKFTMDYLIPIFSKGNSDNPIIGILVANIDLNNSLYKILSDKVGLGKTGETLIVNQETFALSQLRWFENAPLNLKISADPAKYAASGKTGLIKTIDYRDEYILAAYTYIPKMKWGFICKQDIYELNAPIRQMMGNFVIIFIVISIIVVLFSFSISNTITNPIIELNKSAIKISAGDYSIKNIINTQDEIGSLGISVNEMASSIRSKINIQKQINNISNNIIGLSSLQEFSTVLIEQLKAISKANWNTFYILNETNSKFVPYTSLGIKIESLKPIPTKKSNSAFSLALSKKGAFRLRDFPEDTFCNSESIDNFIKPKEIITIPIVIEKIITAFVLLAKSKTFDKESYDILEQSEASINTSYTSLIANLRVSVLAENVLKINDKLDLKTKQLQKQNISLTKQQNIAIEANKELEAFSYSVSHDLRAPLRHIDGFTKLLYKTLGNKVDEKSQSYFDNVISASKQMNTLIDDLLVFSRMGRKEVKKGKINMGKIVDTALKSFTNDIKKTKISIIIDAMPDANVDASLLTQVWINLISNALKFSSNIKKPKIHIGLDKDKNQNTVYFIKDNGVGFEQKYVEKLFGVFQRLHSINEFPGTGIGLANVKRIIIKHGGNIWAEGKINKGASFFFTLPNA